MGLAGRAVPDFEQEHVLFVWPADRAKLVHVLYLWISPDDPGASGHALKRSVYARDARQVLECVGVPMSKARFETWEGNAGVLKEIRGGMLDGEATH